MTCNDCLLHLEIEKPKQLPISIPSPKSQAVDKGPGPAESSTTSLAAVLSEVQKLSKLTYSVHLMGINEGDLKVFRRRVLFSRNPVDQKTPKKYTIPSEVLDKVKILYESL